MSRKLDQKTKKVARTGNAASLPKADSFEVLMLCNIHNLKAEPVYLEYQDFGYEKDWCHISAKHRALNYGGKRIHGWSVWLFGNLAIAEFHSVWETPEGELVDVTPPKYDGGKILFIRDDTAGIKDVNGDYLMWTNRTSEPNGKYYWLGKPTQYDSWNLAPNKADLVAYCAKLNIPVSEILT